MIAALREVRLSRFQFAVVAAIAGIATALIITTALGRTAAQSAAIAALHAGRWSCAPPLCHRVPASRP